MVLLGGLLDLRDATWIDVGVSICQNSMKMKSRARTDSWIVDNRGLYRGLGRSHYHEKSF